MFLLGYTFTLIIHVMCLSLEYACMTVRPGLPACLFIACRIAWRRWVGSGEPWTPRSTGSNSCSAEELVITNSSLKYQMASFTPDPHSITSLLMSSSRSVVGLFLVFDLRGFFNGVFSHDSELAADMCHRQADISKGAGKSLLLAVVHLKRSIYLWVSVCC